MESKIDFVVRLVGSGVKPWHVPMRSLSRLMDAIQRLVEQSEEEEPEEPNLIPTETPDQVDPQLITLASPVLKLVGVRSSSAGYSIATPFKESALGVLKETGKAIGDPSNSDWTVPTILSLKNVSEVAKSLGVKVEIRKPPKGKKLGDVIATILPETYEKVADAAFVDGQTSLFGTIERIGGASAARCAIRLPEQSKLVYCSLESEELAKKLSPYLYQSLSVYGDAKYLRANWQVLSFQITSFDEPKTGSFQDALAEIWRAGGKAWDKVDDPMAELRGK